MSQWKCPFTKQSDCKFIHAIGRDGGLKHCTATVLAEMQKQGWVQVVFPKQTYYWDRDQTHPSFIEKENINLVDNTDELQLESV